MTTGGRTKNPCLGHTTLFRDESGDPSVDPSPRYFVEIQLTFCQAEKSNVANNSRR